jgi:hypothetical protein
VAQLQRELARHVYAHEELLGQIGGAAEVDRGVVVPIQLRTGSYFPEWLLERRRRAEQALLINEGLRHVLSRSLSESDLRLASVL